MQLVNHDMDDLFKKAAEDYPLQTDGADWKKVQEAMAATNLQEPVKKRRRFFLLLLLIPFAVIGNYYLQTQEEDGGAGNKKKATSQTIEESRTANDAADVTLPTEDIIPDRTEANMNQPHPADKNTSATLVKTVEAGGKPGVQNKKAKLVFGDKPRTITKGQISKYTNVPAGGNLSQTKKVQSTPLNGTSKNFKTTRIESSLRYPGFSLSAIASHKTIVTPQVHTIADAKNNSKKFYAGLLAAVEANTIKFQKVKSAGYNVGIVLGYRFADRWSVESGINLSRKFYYTEGAYFSTRKLYLPPNTSITSAEGFCRMWELPIQLRYTFKKQNRHQWVVALGTSSYFMKSEDYDLGYYYQQSNRTVIHNRKYNTAYTHLFAALNLSGGYSKSINRIGQLSIEPYFTIPLKPVGTGGLYLQSGGLRLTLTRDVF